MTRSLNSIKRVYKVNLGLPSRLGMHAMKTFSLKVADNDPVAVYLASQPNISAALRAIVADYLARGDAGRPPPQREPEPQPPMPATGIDYQKMGEVIYQAMRQALSEVQIAIPTGAALNEVEPEKMKDDHLLDEIMQGLGSWA